MIAEEKEVVLKNGLKVLLRSPEPSEALELLEHMRKTSEETHFMVRYAEEITTPEAIEKEVLTRICESERDFMLAAFVEGEMVGNAAVQTFIDRKKCLHRGSFGISIQEKVCSTGLGTLMMTDVLEQAGKNGFEQLELGVFEDNPRAIHLYKRMGFKEMGNIPHAFYLKDGTYRDEIQMVCMLKK